MKHQSLTNSPLVLYLWYEIDSTTEPIIIFIILIELSSATDESVNKSFYCISKAAWLWWAAFVKKQISKHFVMVIASFSYVSDIVNIK